MWRWYEKRDKAAVKAIHRAMEQRIGRTLDLPALDEEPVIASIVYEKDGVILHSMFLEAEVEAGIVSEKPLSAKCAQEAIDQFLLPTAQKYHLRIARAFVPANLMPAKRTGRTGAVPRLLSKLGFTRENDSMVQFFRWLVPPDDGKGN